MALVFPTCQHIPLRNPPLREVVCQVRMPAILKIAQETPAEFQDRIRGRFPIVQAEKGLLFAPNFNRPDPPLVQPLGTTHRFLDKDEKRTVSLGMEFYALSTTEYKGWDAFAEDLAFVTDAMLSVYVVPYATRVGLRYINALNMQNTGQDDFRSGVLALLRENLTKLLHEDAIRNSYFALTQIRAHQDNGEFTFQAGVVEEEDPAFLLDFDRYIQEPTELRIDNFLKLCSRYHAEIYNAFRWCLTPEALEIFGPTEDVSK